MCLPIAGTWTMLHLQRRAVRHAVKKQLIAGVEKTELTLLTFRMPQDAHRLEWEEEGEFAFEGQMYDVVEQHTVGDSVFYRCWADNEETVLYRRFEELFAQVWPDAPQPNKTKEQILEFWKKMFGPPFAGLAASSPLPEPRRSPAKIRQTGPNGAETAQPISPPPEKIG